MDNTRNLHGNSNTPGRPRPGDGLGNGPIYCPGNGEGRPRTTGSALSLVLSQPFLMRFVSSVTWL